MHLSAIAIYPVKGCRRTPLERARVGARGLARDREWMVVRPDGFFLTQRTYPGLARIVPHLTERGLRLEHPEHAPVEVDSVAATAPIKVTIWGHKTLARDGGEAAAEWLSAVLGVPARLAGLAADTEMHADREFVGERDVPISFTDGFPLLVCNRASLDDLNRRSGDPVPMERFRPNLVIDGLGAFAEDSIRRLRIGAVPVSLVKPCTRCVVPSIDQHTGQKSADPTPTLKQFRFDKKLRGVTFGVNGSFEVGPGAELAIGDPVEILD
jgi:uncharacterized protein YcbX